MLFKRSLASLIPAALVVGVLIGGAAPIAEFAGSFFHDHASGLSIEPPAFDATTPNRSVAIFFDEPKNGLAANVNLLIQPPMSLKAYGEMSEREFVENGITVDRREDLEIDGRPARLYEYHGKIGIDRTLAFVSVAVQYPAYTALATGTCLPEDLDHYRPLFEASLKSLRVEGE